MAINRIACVQMAPVLGDLKANLAASSAAIAGAVAGAVAKIRAAGKIAGTLVFKHEMARWVAAGVQFFYVHSDPFLREGLREMRELAGRQ